MSWVRPLGGGDLVWVEDRGCPFKRRIFIQTDGFINRLNRHGFNWQRQATGDLMYWEFVPTYKEVWDAHKVWVDS